MSELHKASPNTPIAIVVSVPNVPRDELDRLGFAGKDHAEIADTLAIAEKYIERLVTRKDLPETFENKDIVDLIMSCDAGQFMLVHRPQPKPEVVRQLTIVQAVGALIRLTDNVNHFSKNPADIEVIHTTLRETTEWWPGYGAVMAEARVNLLLVGQVIKDNFPGIVNGFPGLSGRVLQTVQRILAQLEGMDSDGNIPAAMVGTYTTQEFWLSVIAKAEKDSQVRRDMYNLDVERKRNPGKLLVGKQWLEYGTVFHDDQQTEVVVINHQIVPKDTLELKAQGMENILAVMSSQFAAPAIDLINELGGNMFAAICRGGIARIHGMVDSCYKASIADLKPEPEMLQRSLSGGVYEGQGGVAPEAYLTKERPDHPMDELLKEPAELPKPEASAEASQQL